jgi:hypothetical protein
MLGKAFLSLCRTIILAHHCLKTTLFLVMLENVEKLMESTLKEHYNIDISGEGTLEFYKLITS